jgi:hypothetical protein
MPALLLASLVLAFAGPGGPAGAAPARVFNVRDQGARGDGQTLDTAAINKAIEACTAAGGGQVVFPPGRYLSGTVHLLSRVTLFLEAGATLVGTTNLDLYETFHGTNATPRLHVSRWHRGLVLAEGAEDIAIAGQGVIDGRHVFDPRGEERMRGPHAILLGHCRNFTFRDATVSNAANYGLLFFFTDQVEVTNATFAGGWDGVHFRGSLERFCNDVRITDCRFYTGDDSIAGSYWRRVVVSNCVINSSCNGIRLIGPALDSTITRCQFFGPGRHEHRTSGVQHRTNMLAGICLQPGAWEPMNGPLDNFRISDITMENVTTPFHIALRAGNTAGRIEVERVKVTGAYRTACSVEAWGGPTFSNVVFRDVSIEFTGGGKPEEARLAVRPPGVDARRLPAWGLFARGVQQLRLENVQLTCARDDGRPMFLAENVERLSLDRFRCSRPASAPDLMLLNDLQSIELQNSDLLMAAPRCMALSFAAEPAANRIAAGKPFLARVSVENGGQEGLGKVELTVDGVPVTRWAWLRANEKKEVVFRGLTAPAAGRHEVRCGSLTQPLEVAP